DLVVGDVDDLSRPRKFCEKRACRDEHPLTLDEIEPRTFSFNARYGACPECTGIGFRLEVDPELIVPDDEKTLREGAVAPWAQTSSEYFERVLTALADEMKFSMDEPGRALPERASEAILHGRDPKVHVRYKDRWGRQRQSPTG